MKIHKVHGTRERSTTTTRVLNEHITHIRTKASFLLLPRQPLAQVSV